MSVRERNIIEHVNKIAPRFQEGIKAFATGSPIIGEVFISMFRFFKHFQVSDGAHVPHKHVFIFVTK